MAAPNSPPASPPRERLSFPTDAPYSAAFTNALMQTVNNPPAHRSGTTIYTSGLPRSGPATRLEDIDTSALPSIPPSDLPLPLEDPHRIYESNVPGVRLTHPGGSLHGGTRSSVPTSSKDPAGPAEDIERYAQQLIERYELESAAQLKRVIARETAKQNKELSRRMSARQEALKGNERLDWEVGQLKDQREFERRLEQKMKEESKRRRESA